jgi:drug/metabolite transporter (DMT)-like permease
LGALGAGGHFLIIKAMAFAPASTLSPFLYSHILTATLISVAYFGDPLSLSIVLGIVLLVGSGLYIWQRERVLAQKAALQAKAG